MCIRTSQPQKESLIILQHFISKLDFVCGGVAHTFEVKNVLKSSVQVKVLCDRAERIFRSKHLCEKCYASVSTRMVCGHILFLFRCLQTSELLA